MIAFKGTDNFQCINKTYEVGKTYYYNKELIICKQGLHFCQKLENVHWHYHLFNPQTVVLKIEVLGKIINNGDKSVTNKFKVLEIIPNNQYHRYSNNVTKNSIKIILKNSWKKYKFDKNNNEIYFENSDGYWEKRKYDKNNNVIYYENSYGYCSKRKYDKDRNEIYYEDSNGYWEKKRYDKNGNEIYYKNSL